MKLYSIVSAITLMFLTGPSFAADCLSYSEVKLTGVLSQEVFPGPPNYESIEAGDKAETLFFITLPSPVCVSQGDESGFQPEVSSIQRVQLIIAIKGAYASLNSKLGKQVTCRGRFMGAHTGHHHSEVMLNNAQCIVDKKSNKGAGGDKF